MPRSLTLFATLASVVLLSPLNSLAQDGDDLGSRRKAFTAAWLARDSDAVTSFLTSDASVLPETGGDLSNAGGALSRINRYFKDTTSSETMVDHKVVRHGDTAIVTVVARVDHKGKQKTTSAPQRQTQVWVRAGGVWKLAHMHVSAYTNFATSIAAFQRADKAAMPKPGGVVFVGSSSILLWKTLQEDFPDANAVHRGFGGSQLVDSIMYAHRIITPYKPSKVVVYAGDNDVNAGKDARRVLQDFKTLVESIHSRVPNAKIGFIAIKPSRSRWKIWPEMDKANKLVAEFAATDPRLTYFDIATPMLGENGTKPAADWFVSDGLHMKPKGYALWTSIIKPWVDAD